MSVIEKVEVLRGIVIIIKKEWMWWRKREEGVSPSEVAGVGYG
jgi:hypothetical protein